MLTVLGESRAATEGNQQLAALQVVRDGRVAYLGDFSTPFAGALKSAVGGTPAST